MMGYLIFVVLVYIGIIITFGHILQGRQADKLEDIKTLLTAQNNLVALQLEDDPGGEEAEG